MKKVILIALAAVPMAVCAQVDYSVIGKIEGLSREAKAYLYYDGGGSYVLDSASTDNGTFKFHGSLPQASKAMVLLMHEGEDVQQAQQPDMIEIYLEQGAVTLTSVDSLRNANVKGASLNKEFEEYKEQLKVLQSKMMALNERYLAASDEERHDPEFIGGLQAEAATIQGEQKDIDFNYINSRPNSYVSLDLLAPYVNMEPLTDVIEPAFNKLGPSLRNSDKGKAIAEKIENLKRLDIGAIAPDFTQPDTLGNDLTLSSLRGKYVLVDFWASWCGPCRVENPNVVEAYQRFKDKNFTVLGVSLDRPGAKDAWMKAIHDDGLQDWQHVSDLKFWQSEAARVYAIESIPQNYLIDPEGKIIAKNLRGEELQEALEEILN